MKIEGTLQRIIPIITPGSVLSQPPRSDQSVVGKAVHDGLSQIGNQLAREQRELHPFVVRADAASEETVVNSRGVLPASSIPALAASTWKPWVMLQGSARPSC